MGLHGRYYLSDILLPSVASVHLGYTLYNTGIQSPGQWLKQSQTFLENGHCLFNGLLTFQQ